MKHLQLALLTFAIVLCATGAQAAADTIPQRKRVAVVLSGGGAKGTAHIGALRVLERVGIPIDIITGTSMGALIGGLYSIGYDADTLDSLVMAQDWGKLLSDKAETQGQNLEEREKQHTYLLSRPLSIMQKKRAVAGGLIVGTNLSKLFSRLTVGWHDSIDFSRLPIPFACAATDIVKNTEYDFHSGYLTEAMRASMAIPGVFTPIRKDSLVLVDGGLKNNYPADLARQMGADVIIGVSVQGDGRTADDLKSAPDVLMQLVDINCKNKLAENQSITDVLIRVPVKGFSSASFTRSAIDTLVMRGEQAALKQYSRLMQLKKDLGLSEAWQPDRKHRAVPSDESLRVLIDTVEFENIADVDGRYITSKYGLRRIDGVKMSRIEEAVTMLSANCLYTNVRYTLRKQGHGYALRISAGDHRTSQVSLGVRFDTEETVALQANLSHSLNTRVPIDLEITGRLGKRMMARIDATLAPLHYGKLGFSYIFRHSDINIYSHGDRDYNFTCNSHSLRLRLIRLNLRNFSLDMGAQADFHDFHDVLTGGRSDRPIDNVRLYSYQFRVNYNSEDKWFFTSRGANLTAGCGFYTDNFLSYKGHTGVMIADALWRIACPLSARFTLQPMLYGRFLSKDNMPLILQNAIGGELPGHYFEHQLPFAGVGHVEFTDDMLLCAQLKAQQRIMDNNYIVARLSFACHDNKLKRLFSHSPMTGCEAAYYYDSMFGPLGATLGFSSLTKQPYFCISLGFHF